MRSLHNPTHTRSHAHTHKHTHTYTRTRPSSPAYDFGNECLHGTRVTSSNVPADVVKRGATVFPQPLGMAATFDTDLLQHVGSTISDESRASTTANHKTAPFRYRNGAPYRDVKIRFASQHRQMLGAKHISKPD